MLAQREIGLLFEWFESMILEDFSSLSDFMVPLVFPSGFGVFAASACWGFSV